ncbi:MAG: peptidyl-prolyl cis-trans isomerase [Candidatus Krumholzibacteria bacterium]|nr:peptidyl-prolyl cis-trans isomerase [Candidatus Krumholzibacteria bacterium]MDP6797629.1 peptidyl-prolyl cis-trans isomerase [Candidatus Krumholzibacteria bacterium]MDP7021660.1 peptidyl-prolyl cis-trans isomerase [Candidatus Krumholzibacteria bacterium]
MKKTCILSLLLLLFLGACGEKASEGDSVVLATIGDETITQSDFDAELEKVPPFQRRDMETPEGRAKFLERMVEMEALYLAAKDAGMEGDEDVVAEHDYAVRQIMMKHYYKKHIEAAAKPGDEDIADYYESHAEEFVLKAKVHARMILSKSEDRSREIAKKLSGGADFLLLASEENEDPALSAESGDLGWFTRDGYVRSVGVKQEFTDLVFAQEIGSISDPIEIENIGWAIVLLEEREDARQQDLEEVRSEIIRRLEPKAREKMYRDSLDALKEKYNAEIFPSGKLQVGDPEELFLLAQDTKDPRKRIDYYRQLLEQFGDSEQADRAQFMIGFVFSEELQDTLQAKSAFEAYLEKYPESDLAKDAKYMLDALSGVALPLEP